MHYLQQLQEMLRYLALKSMAILLRFGIRYGMGLPKATPHRILYIPSRNQGRTIKMHVYEPLASKDPRPVLLNLHGSGFILPLHGSDDEFCARVAREANYTVMDLQYRLAPEHPFPAALHDVEDAVKWILKQQSKYDARRVAVSGFSAGGNLALATASVVFPKDTFSSVLTFYPSTNKAIDPRDRKMPDTSGKASPAIMSRLFDACYIPRGADRKNPRISPSFAPVKNFPRNVLIVTGAQDNLCFEAEELAARIESADGGKQVVRRRMQKCGHAWDKMADLNDVQQKAKDEAYLLAIEMLQK